MYPSEVCWRISDFCYAIPPLGGLWPDASEGTLYFVASQLLPIW